MNNDGEESGMPKTLKQFSGKRRTGCKGCNSRPEQCSEALCGVEMKVPVSGLGIRELQNAL